MRYFQQLDESDCAAACLAMISSHFGKAISIAEVRKNAGTNSKGTSLKGILDAAHLYGLSGKAVKGNDVSIERSVPVPFIAHLHMTSPDYDQEMDHFVVVKKIFKKRIEIWDPDPLSKKRYVTYEKFYEDWSGYAIFLKPDIEFKKEKKQNLLLKFLPIVLPHKKEIFFAIIASFLLLIFGLVTSFYYKYLFDEVAYSASKFALNSVSFGMLTVVIVQAFVGAIRYILLSHFSFKADLQLNFAYINHIFCLPISFFESYKSGEIMSRLGDLEKIKTTLSDVVITGIMDCLMFLVSGPILFKLNSKLFLLTFLISFLVGIISFIFSKIFKSLYSKSMAENAEVNGYLFESLNGIQTIKALNAQRIIQKKYEKKKMKSVETNWTVNHLRILHGCISSTLNLISGILVYWIGFSAIIEKTMSFGALISFNSLLTYFTGPLFRLLNVQNDIQESLVAAERTGEILELEIEQQKNMIKSKPDKISGNILFENITFSYNGRRPIYQNFNLELKEGNWTAFVGPSGCGKTTLMKLLLKFYRVQEGRILMDGVDINEIDTEYLRNNIGYVPQDVFLFSGTIAENIALHNPEANKNDIRDAAIKSGADEFIQKLPDKYETMLGEHGGGLSGGEKQRLALARALLGKPSLIILDEATSNLDPITEYQIHNIIRKLREDNIAVVLIAHRLSTVKNCDEIYVIHNGTIIQKGDHNGLLKEEGLYKRMWLEMNE